VLTELISGILLVLDSKANESEAFA